jgi:CheY-like chemotaxis protein
VAIVDTRMSGMDGFAAAEAIRKRPGEGLPILMMLSSSSQGAEAVRCHELGGLPYVVKPVGSSLLHDALLTMLDPSDAQRAAADALAPVPAPATPERRLKVLVAEDNHVNRRLVLALLTDMGHEVTLVSNGREAVEAARAGGLDIALLDVHMPEMDGLEAVSEIRAIERARGGHLPIAALTARALKGDREACLAAGMDDYLPKPIRKPALVEVIARLTGGAAPASAAASSIDHDELLERVAGDRQLLAELVEILHAESPRLLGELRRCIDAGDASGVEDAAHAIKGSVGNFGARAAVDSALALEMMGRDGALGGAPPELLTLEHAVAALERDLAALTAPGRS